MTSKDENCWTCVDHGEPVNILQAKFLKHNINYTIAGFSCTTFINILAFCEKYSPEVTRGVVRVQSRHSTESKVQRMRHFLGRTAKLLETVDVHCVCCWLCDQE